MEIWAPLVASRLQNQIPGSLIRRLRDLTQESKAKLDRKYNVDTHSREYKVWRGPAQTKGLSVSEVSLLSQCSLAGCATESRSAEGSLRQGQGGAAEAEAELRAGGSAGLPCSTVAGEDAHETDMVCSQVLARLEQEKSFWSLPESTST